MTKGANANALGKNQDGKWLQLALPDAANNSWVSTTFLTVTGPVDTLQVVQVAPVPTATRGAVVATKPAPTAPLVIPAPRGGIGFVFFEEGSSSYIFASLSVETHSVSGIQKLGARPGPFDVNPDSRTNAAPFAWSPDRSQAVYVYSQSGRPSPDILKYLKPGAFDSPVTLDTHLCISSPTWLPDNKTVAYIGMDENCTTQYIYKIRADGNPLDQSQRNFYRARSGESLRGLAWGPFVLYVSNLSGNQEIWRLNQDGASPTQVTTDSRENGSPAWSPTGTTFAYYSKQADGSFQIMIRNADGSNPRKLTSQGHNFSPTFSPDGNWIAFMSDRGGRMDIYIMDRTGGQVQLLTDKTAAGGFFPGTWR
jgi:Tol biopolymer transport system component